MLVLFNEKKKKMSETIERTRGSVALFAYPNAANTKRRNLIEKIFSLSQT